MSEWERERALERVIRESESCEEENGDGKAAMAGVEASSSMGCDGLFELLERTGSWSNILI